MGCIYCAKFFCQHTCSSWGWGSSLNMISTSHCKHLVASAVGNEWLTEVGSCRGGFGKALCIFASPLTPQSNSEWLLPLLQLSLQSSPVKQIHWIFQVSSSLVSLQILLRLPPSALEHSDFWTLQSSWFSSYLSGHLLFSVACLLPGYSSGIGWVIFSSHSVE